MTNPAMVMAGLTEISSWVFIDLRYNSFFRAQRNPNGE
jgi:hypothetical protein